MSALSLNYSCRFYSPNFCADLETTVHSATVVVADVAILIMMMIMLKMLRMEKVSSSY